MIPSLLVQAYLALTPVAAPQQPPPKADKPPAAKPAAKPALPPVSIDQLIEQAALTDPEVKIAEAEMRLALAHLESARMAAVKRVSQLRADIDKAATEVEIADSLLRTAGELASIEDENFKRAVQTNAMSPQEINQYARSRVEQQSKVTEARNKYEQAKINLARLAGEWKRLTAGPAAAGLTRVTLDAAGGEPEGPSALVLDPTTGTYSYYVPPPASKPKADAPAKVVRAKPVVEQPMLDIFRGSPMDQLRRALNAKIRFKAENVTVQFAVEELLRRAEVKAVTRVSREFTADKTQGIISLPEAELPLSAWLALITDELNHRFNKDTGKSFDPVLQGTFYVREYGLTLMRRVEAPPAAMTLDEFIIRTAFKEG